MRPGGGTRAAHDAEVFSRHHRLAHGLHGGRAVLHVPVPGDRSVGVLHVDGVPRAAAHRAVAVVVAVALVHDRARCAGDDHDILVVHLLPRERVVEDVGALVVVAARQVVAARAARVVEHLVRIRRVLVDEVGDAVVVEIGAPRALAQRPREVRERLLERGAELALCDQLHAARLDRALDAGVLLGAHLVGGPHVLPASHPGERSLGQSRKDRQGEGDAKRLRGNRIEHHGIPHGRQPCAITLSTRAANSALPRMPERTTSRVRLASWPIQNCTPPRSPPRRRNAL